MNGGVSKVDHLKEEMYETFNQALEKTKAEVKQMQDKIQEYDDKYQASATIKKQGQKVTDFFKSRLDEIKATLDDLTEKAHKVFVQAKEFSVEQAEKVIKAFRDAVEKLKKLAVEFDERFGVSQKLNDLMAPLLKALEKMSETLKDMGKNSRSYLINVAANIETKFAIEERLSDLDQKFKIVEKAKQLQEKGEEFIEKQHLRERVKNLDERLTGSKAGTYLEEGMKLMKEELGKIHQEFEIARENSRENLQDMAAGARKENGLKGISAMPEPTAIKSK